MRIIFYLLIILGAFFLAGNVQAQYCAGSGGSGTVRAAHSVTINTPPNCNPSVSCANGGCCGTASSCDTADGAVYYPFVCWDNCNENDCGNVGEGYDCIDPRGASSCFWANGNPNPACVVDPTCNDQSDWVTTGCCGSTGKIQQQSQSHPNCKRCTAISCVKLTTTPFPTNQPTPTPTPIIVIQGRVEHFRTNPVSCTDNSTYYINGALVVLYDINGNYISDQYTADYMGLPGAFRFIGVPPGSYKLCPQEPECTMNMYGLNGGTCSTLAPCLDLLNVNSTPVGVRLIQKSSCIIPNNSCGTYNSGTNTWGFTSSWSPATQSQLLQIMNWATGAFFWNQQTTSPRTVSVPNGTQVGTRTSIDGMQYSDWRRLSCYQTPSVTNTPTPPTATNTPTPVPSSCLAGYTGGPVTWDTNQSMGVSINGNSITRNSINNDDWGSAGARSVQYILVGGGNSGYIEFTAGSNTTNVMAGLGERNTTFGYTDINFAIHPRPGEIRVSELGNVFGSYGTYTSTDKFRVNYNASGMVVYSKNGTSFYVNTAPTPPATGYLYLDTSIYEQGASINNAIICQLNVTPTSTPTSTPTPVSATPTPATGCQNVVWQNLKNATKNADNSITRNVGGDWWTAPSGANSVQDLTIFGPANTGYVEYSVGPNISSQAFGGLNIGDTGANFEPIDFALHERTDQHIIVYQNGAAGTDSAGPHTASTRIRVTRTASYVSYSFSNDNWATSTEIYRNNTPTIGGPLHFDSALGSLGDTISNAIICPLNPVTPTPITVQEPWIKLKNASFQSRDQLNSMVPDASVMQPFQTSDWDDITGIAFFDTETTSDGSYYQGGVISTNGIISPTPAKLSSPKWTANNNGSLPTQFDVNSFYRYVKARKQYKTITSLSEISPANGHMYYYKYNGSNSPLVFTNPPSTDAVIIVDPSIAVTIQGNPDTSIPKRYFNTTGITGINPTVNLAIIADTIIFDPEMNVAFGIYVGKSVNTGSNTNRSLKIKGNLISTQTTSMQRQRSPANNAPALFVVFDPSVYIRLLPYLSFSMYDWRELPAGGSAPQP